MLGRYVDVRSTLGAMAVGHVRFEGISAGY
jgi:hypothetical protein